MLFGILLIGVSTVRGDEPAAATHPAETQTIKSERYLGVVTEPIPEALAAQLKNTLTSGRGLLVKRVLPDSPAAKAGLQPFDVVFQAQGQGVATSAELKAAITSPATIRPLTLQIIRGAKVQTVDILPGERTLSRVIVRHRDTDTPIGEETVRVNPAGQADAPSPAYAVSVQTKNGRDFRVDVHVGGEDQTTARHKFNGDAAQITERMKSLPEPARRSLARQLALMSADRPTSKTVQFRFRPQREGNRQMLTVTLRKPDVGGAMQSFELQQPMGEMTASVPLEKLLENTDLAAQLQDLDPAVRARIESTLKTVAMPAGKLKIEDSQ